MTVSLASIVAVRPQPGMVCASCRRWATYEVTRWDGTGLTTACATHKDLWFRRLSGAAS